LKKSILIIAAFAIIIIVAAPNLIPIISAATESAWTTKTPLPKAAAHFKAEAVNNKIYVFGPNQTYMYDLSSWLPKQPMPSSRDSFATATYQNRIYCIGGRRNGPSAVNEAYNPTSDSWETKQSMPTPRHGLDANVVDQKIYLISGLVPDNRWPNVNVDVYSTYRLTNATEVYDPSTDTWSTKAPIPKPASYYASAVIDKKIYIFSQNYNQNDGTYEPLTQIYDPNTDTWTNANPPPYAVDMAASTVVANSDNKRIYLIGGRSSGLQVGYNQIYDPATDSWSIGAPMSTARYALAICSLNAKIYTFGGYQGAFVTVTLRANNEQYDPSKDTTTPITTSPTPTPKPSPSTSPSPTQTTPAEPPLNPSIIAVATLLIAGSIGLVIFNFKTNPRKNPKPS